MWSFSNEACLAAREAHFVRKAMLRIVKRLRAWVARFTSRCAKHNTSQRHHRCFACRTVAGFTKCCRFLRKKCLHFLREAFIIILHILPLCRYDGIGRRSGLKIHRWRHRAGSTPATGTIHSKPANACYACVCGFSLFPQSVASTGIWR